MNRDEISSLLTLMSQIYYDEVPIEYRTYCVLTSQITQEVLRHFDAPSYLLPCQMWCATREKNYIIGFRGVDQPNKWDGHIICCTGDFIIDAAVSHFAEQFSIAAPRIVVATRFHIPSHTIARVDLIDDQRIWWQDAPTGSDRFPELEDMKMVKELAGNVIGRLESSDQPARRCAR